MGDLELMTLSTAAHDLTAGRGQIVSLVAEAGLGKSRLAAHLKEQCTSNDPPLRWVEGASFSYDASNPSTGALEFVQGDISGEPYAQATGRGNNYTGAVVNDRHANFIVADEGTSSADLLRLIDLAQSRVEEQFGVDLELEIEIW